MATTRELLTDLIAAAKLAGDYPAPITLPLPPDLVTMELGKALHGCVNDRDLCGAARGTLRVNGFTTCKTSYVIAADVALYLNHRPWNDGFPSAYRSTAYEEADFSPLFAFDPPPSETWRDRPPLL